jgi:YHS domain-containing protein
MVNNQYMGRPQIPVSVNGKTYFGCCEMCKGKLERDVAARTATDPVSGRQVDKAAALIGKTSTGDVLYFESQDTFAAYGPK